MKLKIKINLIFVLTGFVLTAGAIGILYYYTSFNLHVEVFGRLDAIAKGKGDHIETYLDQTKGRMTDFASDGKIKDCLYALNGNEGISCSSESLSEHLKENKLPAIATLAEVTAIDREGIIVASTQPERIGENAKTKAIFFEAKSKPYIEDAGTLEAIQQQVFFVSAPVYRDDDFMGVIAGAFTLEQLNNVVQSTAGTAETANNFVVNQNGYILTPTRYEDDVVLVTRVDTLNRQECVEDYREFLDDQEVKNHVESILVYDDHKNSRVIGSHAYVEEMNWCVIAEVHESEALQPVKSSLTFFAIVGFMILIVVFFVANALSNVVVKPTIQLRDGLKIIEEGHLDHSVAMKDENEFGELSRSIDKLVQTLRKIKEEALRNKKDNT